MSDYQNTPRMHPVGTRFSNSEIFDAATNQIVFGFQVFEQTKPDGTLTGRKSFINNSGNLCGIEIAEHMRKSAIVDSAPDVIKALRDLRAQVLDYENRTGEKNFNMDLTDSALAMAIGVSN